LNYTIYYLCCFLPLLLIFLSRKKRRMKIITHHIKRKKLYKENKIMTEFAKQFIGKNCIIYLLESQIAGTIKEISEDSNAILIENGNNTEIINLEYVTRIRKYPTNKKGKEKSVVLD